MTLVAEDFPAFFEEVHGHEPFPWQHRLLRQVAEEGEWPPILDLPTGSGKTAAIDIAVFHLALEANSGFVRRAPVRIAFVVNRRLVVDDAFERAKSIEAALDHPRGQVTGRVAGHLKGLSGGGPPLVVRRLRGGIPREDDWARSPSQPTVLCSTVDQVGSRLLFRGYGVTDSMKPVHAGLIGSDCLILLDEAHLAEPFRQTLGWLKLYQGRKWREVDEAAPWRFALLTATPGEQGQECFSLENDDKAHPVLEKRLSASKPARLITLGKPKRRANAAAPAEDEGEESDQNDLSRRATAIVEEVRKALEHFSKSDRGVIAPAIGVVVNRVARARTVFERIRSELKAEIEAAEVGEPILMIGPARPVERDTLAVTLGPIRTQIWRAGERRPLQMPLILVATQCIEAGVDLDFDALITEAASLDALRQRFGRLNRAGREIEPYASIVCTNSDLSPRHDDPIYGRAIHSAWRHLTEASERSSGKVVDFGLGAFSGPMESDALAPKADAPVLLPAHVDLLTQTSPIPAADPDIGLYLHGTDRQADSITIVWRADVDPDRHRHDETRSILMLARPRSAEAIELPIWAVRRWLMGRDRIQNYLGDVAGMAPEEDVGRLTGGAGLQVFRWRGDDERSRWIYPNELRPGDTVVVPARYGGVDEFGWNPGSKRVVKDVGRTAAMPFVARQFAVRVAPGLLGESVSDEALADALAGAASRHPRDLLVALSDLPLPDEVRHDLEMLVTARNGRIVSYIDLYGRDDQDRPCGVVFVAPLGVKGIRQAEDGQSNSTEDDVAGSLPGFALRLAEHNQDVGEKAEAFARAAGLPSSRIADLKLAGDLHDLGKADPRFQAWLHYGDPLGSDPDHLLAKSGRSLPRSARASSKLPDHWRHEALSVRLALADQRLDEANDIELVLWLIGTHHGHGRASFPHQDPVEQAPAVGPQSLAFDWQGLDWPSLFVRVKARYGPWELARMEAILRLADHRASEARALKDETR